MPTATPPKSASATMRAGSTPAPQKISSKRFDNMRVAPAFNSGHSRFTSEYAKGALLCHIDHGTSIHRISWDAPHEEICLRRAKLLEICAEGLRETQHPYATIARLAFTDLIALVGCDVLAEETLRRIMASLRDALTSSSEVTSSSKGTAPRIKGVFENGLLALQQLAAVEGPRLLPYLHLVLPPLGKRIFSRGHREKIQETVQVLEKFGGADATKALRARGLFAS